jgi:hypothetical protein
MARELHPLRTRGRRGLLAVRPELPVLDYGTAAVLADAAQVIDVKMHEPPVGKPGCKQLAFAVDIVFPSKLTARGDQKRGSAS